MQTSRTSRVLILLVLLLAVSARADRKTSILETKHNLSMTGSGEIKSLTETQICIFCHGSHNTSTEGPLWNHETTVSGKFKTYDRATMKGQAEQPNGATKLCLSCHDGTIAVGAIRGRHSVLPMRNVGSGGEIPAERKSNIGIDLSGSHPVSVQFRQELALGRPGETLVAATAPEYLTRDEVPAEKVEEEQGIMRAQMKTEDEEKGKSRPEEMIEKILIGKTNKFFSQICFVEQGFVKEDKVSVTNFVAEKGKELDDTITIKRYVRYQLGA